MEWGNQICRIKNYFLHVISTKRSYNAVQSGCDANICSGEVESPAHKNEHGFFVYLLFAVQIILTISCGRAVIPVVGIVLCAVGFIKGKTKVDLWVLVPLILYNVFSCTASYVAHGNIRTGTAYAHLIFPILYLMLSYLDDGAFAFAASAVHCMDCFYGSCSGWRSFFTECWFSILWCAWKALSAAPMRSVPFWLSDTLYFLAVYRKK